MIRNKRIGIPACDRVRITLEPSCRIEYLRASRGEHTAALAALFVGQFPPQNGSFTAAVCSAATQRAFHAAILELVQVALGANVRFVVAVLSGRGLFRWPVHQTVEAPWKMTAPFGTDTAQSNFNCPWKVDPFSASSAAAVNNPSALNEGKVAA
jgi:hypothetical protein